MQIIGAGLAGLLAANVFPTAQIIEEQGREKLEHKAVLRFRSKVVADLTGVEFTRVTVHKGIWHEGRSAAPSIMLANLYSKKVIGKLADRSIWSLEPAERYIAPEDFVTQLIERCSSRIDWNTPFVFENNPGIPIISTMPMVVLAGMLPDVNDCPVFKHKQIFVARYRIVGADVYQTIYFTSPETSVYRASITKDLLIVELIKAEFDIIEVLAAFGLNNDGIEPLGATKQKFGKIAPIDDRWRRNFIYKTSVEHGIYSVGRFAIWKNILLDEVVQDLAVVKRLIQSGSVYEHALNNNKGEAR